MDVHIFFLPFLAPGHMIPMVDLARIFAARGVKSTVVTTAGNVPLIRPILALTGCSVQLLTLPFPSAESGLPDGIENLLAFPTPDVTPKLLAAIELLRRPFADLVRLHRPHCVISDVYYPWARDTLGVPRFAFHGTGCFPQVILGSLMRLGGGSGGDDEPLAVPGLPHRIELTRSRLPDFVIAPNEFFVRMGEAHGKIDGMVMNSFYELEPDYIDLVKRPGGGTKAWHVGPVSAHNREAKHKAVRGGEAASLGPDGILRWLDGRRPGSVVYACFGSVGRFTPSQLREIAKGLEDSEHPFVWVVKCDGGDTAESLAAPPGPEERRAGKGLILTGWAPQLLILNHASVGGFVTHCGWNSLLEGATAGVPMITWPLFAEQFVNEKLVVDVLRVGIPIGSEKCSDRPEERTPVAAEQVRKAVQELMGGGEEAGQRRARAAEIGEQAKRASDEGGSSYAEVGNFIDHLRSLN